MNYEVRITRFIIAVAPQRCVLKNEMPNPHFPQQFTSYFLLPTSYFSIFTAEKIGEASVATKSSLFGMTEPKLFSGKLKRDKLCLL